MAPSTYLGLRDTLQRSRRAPAYAIGVVASLALALSATAAAYAVLDHVLYGQVSWRDPDTLVLLGRSSLESGEVEDVWSFPRLRAIQSSPHGVIDVVAGLRRATVLTTLGAGAPAMPLQAEFTTPDYFEALGVLVPMGRPDRGDADGDPLSVVLSDRLWRREFSGDRAVLGRTFSVNGVSLTISGIAPAAFRGVTGSADLWIPLSTIVTVTGDSLALSEYYWAYQAVVRLHPATSEASRRLELVNLARDLGLTTQAHGASRLIFVPPRDAVVHTTLRSALFVLFGASLCLLLLAAVNVTSLTIAHTHAEGRDIAVCVALGGELRHVGRRFVTQGIALAAVGSLAGLVLSFWLVKGIWAMRPTVGATWVYVLGALGAPPLGIRVVALVFGSFVIVAVLVGAPLFHEVRRLLVRGSPSLLSGRDARRSTAARIVLRRHLASLQIALAFVLVLSALLFASSVGRLRRQHYGFSADHVLTARVNLPKALFDHDRASTFYEAVVDRLSQLGEVISVGVDNTLPLLPSPVEAALSLHGSDSRDRPGEATHVRYHTVSEGYFAALDIPLMLGQRSTFRERRPSLALITRHSARQLWGGRQPLGQMLGSVRSTELDGEWHVLQVSGIIADVQYDVPGTPPDLDVFVPVYADPPRDAYLAIRTRGNPDALRGSLRDAVTGADPHALLYDIIPMQQRVHQASSATAFIALLLSIYGALALGIALIGVYSVMSYGVDQRRSELAIRMALGASPQRIVCMVLREGAQVSALGVFAGVLASAATYRLIAHYLFGVTFLDISTQGTCVALFAVVALAASLAPAIRAMRVDPATALRAT